MKAYLTVEEHDQMDEVYYYYHFYTDNSEIDIDFAVGIHDNNYNEVINTVESIIRKYSNYIKENNIGKLRIYEIDASIDVICSVATELVRTSIQARKAFDAEIKFYYGGVSGSMGSFTIYAYSKEEALSELEEAVRDAAKFLADMIGGLERIERKDNGVMATIRVVNGEIARVEGYFIY